MTKAIKQFLEADALLPCPFCGAKPYKELSKVMERPNSGERYQLFIWICPHGCCQATANTRDDATKQWNTRTPDRNLLAAFEQVCEAAGNFMTENGLLMLRLADALPQDLECLDRGVVRAFEKSEKTLLALQEALTAAAPYRKQGGE